MQQTLNLVIKRYLTEAYKWTEDALRDEALKYKNKKEFYQNSASAYGKALNMGQDFFSDITKHFTETPKIPSKWNEESLAKEALKYNSKTEFRSGSPGAYDVAKKIGKEFYDKITSHMPEVRPRKWTEQSLEDDAKKYIGRKEFFDNSQGAYLAAKRKGDDFFDKITSHMTDQRGPSQIIWTEEILKKLLQKYLKLSDFRNEQPRAYSALVRKPKEFIDSVTQHMEKRRGPYTDDELKNIALKYTNASSFQKEDGSAYVASKNRDKDFFNEITKHFQRLSRIPYTYDEVKKEAEKYQTIGEFQKNSRGAYVASRRHGWFPMVTQHMIPVRNSWTKNEIKKIASNYTTLRDFRKENSAAYSWALQNLNDVEKNEVYGHMQKLGNHANRLIYAFEFPDKSVYVGLTYDPIAREGAHKANAKSAVNKHALSTGLKPTMKHLTDYVFMDEAAKKEKEFVEDYKNKGWKILNRAKAGALGSDILKWTFEKVAEEAKKYDTRTAFERGNGSAYGAARVRGWLDDVTKHMKLIKPSKYTPDEMRSIALEFDKLIDFREKKDGVYQAAKKQGDNFFNDITRHMSKGPKKGSIWDDFEKVKNEALKYTNGHDFRKYSSGAYKSAFRNKWYDKVRKHFVRYANKKWTYDTLKQEAQKYTTKRDFFHGNNSAYTLASRYGYMNDFFPQN